MLRLLKGVGQDVIIFKNYDVNNDIVEVDVEKLNIDEIKKIFNADEWACEKMIKMDELSHGLFNDFKNYVNNKTTLDDYDWYNDWDFGEMITDYFNYRFDANYLVNTEEDIRVNDEYYKKHHWIDIFKKLRKQICIGGYYLSDYENEMGIDAEVAYDVFNGYEDFVIEDAIEHGDDESSWDKYDTEDCVENWIYCMTECNGVLDKAIMQHELSKLDLI